MCNKSLSKKWGRLAQGNKYGIQSTNTIDCIHQQDVPAGRDMTYAIYLLDYWPLKYETHRVRIIVGGSILSYSDDA